MNYTNIFQKRKRVATHVFSKHMVRPTKGERDSGYRDHFTPAEARAAERKRKPNTAGAEARTSTVEAKDKRGEGIAAARAREVDGMATQDATPVLDDNPGAVRMNERDVAGRDLRAAVGHCATEVPFVSPEGDGSGEPPTIRPHEELGDPRLNTTAGRTCEEVGVGARTEVGERHGVVAKEEMRVTTGVAGRHHHFIRPEIAVLGLGHSNLAVRVLGVLPDLGMEKRGDEVAGADQLDGSRDGRSRGGFDDRCGRRLFAADEATGEEIVDPVVGQLAAGHCLKETSGTTCLIEGKLGCLSTHIPRIGFRKITTVDEFDELGIGDSEHLSSNPNDSPAVFSDDEKRTGFTDGRLLRRKPPARGCVSNLRQRLFIP